MVCKNLWIKAHAPTRPVDCDVESVAESVAGAVDSGVDLERSEFPRTARRIARCEADSVGRDRERGIAPETCSLDDRSRQCSGGIDDVAHWSEGAQHRRHAGFAEHGESHAPQCRGHGQDRVELSYQVGTEGSPTN